MTLTPILESFESGPLAVNCLLIGNPETREALVIDPGGDADHLEILLRRHGLKLTHILATHGHFDHIGAVAELKKTHACPFWLHPDDQGLVQSAKNHARQWGILFGDTPTVDHPLAHGDALHLAGLTVEVIHTPGHTPGGVCFRIGDWLVVGDTLFAGSIGRTDLPGGNHGQLLSSIAQRLLTLKGDLRCLTGHGPTTSLDRERRSNPFLKGL